MSDTRRAGTGAAASPAGAMTEAQFRSMYDELRGQLPWGPDDRRGALNYITPAEVLAARGVLLDVPPWAVTATTTRPPAPSRAWTSLYTCWP